MGLRVSMASAVVITALEEVPPSTGALKLKPTVGFEPTNPGQESPFKGLGLTTSLRRQIKQGPTASDCSLERVGPFVSST